ncbi:PiggyBac transposable element-derived protein 3 [Amphibalanus amphitrite]|uniref:PiggyBac transposable element-derived protein 3 n=1 Tax=Amphibalanus amphitrite TaxID=1232801 RepID=A0A6A4WBZ4_AMPAM|nr:PiggyBac transposable element-derived protein 3 [Amphibalanus amphitrite]KAF0308749.1 PiggyBac transposable element-derived protein 3 [Amphibalanus amphitrite]
MGVWVVENVRCSLLSFSRFGKLIDLLDEVDESGESPATVFLCPPNVREDSDADSGDEDGGGTIDNLNRNLLQADAELVGQEDGSDDEAAESVAPTSHRWGKREVASFLKEREEACPYPQVNFSNKTPVEVLSFFLDDEFYAQLLQETRRYIQWRGKNVQEPSIAELKAVMAILYFSGYHNVPNRRAFWSTDPDLHVEFVSRIISRNRFDDILSVLHFADNQRLDPSDKMAKLRPLFNSMQDKFLRAFQRPPSSTELDVDESMIPYYGRHGCKQFLRGKPIRFGFKAWCLNSPDGYLLTFEVYQGASGTAQRPDYEAAFGKCGSAVKILIDRMPKEMRMDALHIFTDNLFTSLPLMMALKEEGIGHTGTIRQNRLRGCPLSSVAAMKKAPRGDTSVAVETKQGINLVRWKDNSVVTVASTVSSSRTVAEVQRWSRREKKRIKVAQPQMIQDYNCAMGGTDRMDQNIGAYRIAIRQKKFWWCIFCWLLGAAMQNAWLLYRQHHPGENQINFIRAIVRYHLAETTKPPSGRPSSASSQHRVPASIRYDGINHLVVPLAKQGTCANKEGKCKSHPKTACRKCQVPLCVACFVPFHAT